MLSYVVLLAGRLVRCGHDMNRSGSENKQVNSASRLVNLFGWPKAIAYTAGVVLFV
jgi:hypothetical protein